MTDSHVVRLGSSDSYPGTKGTCSSSCCTVRTDVAEDATEFSAVKGPLRCESLGSRLRALHWPDALQCVERTATLRDARVRRSSFGCVDGQDDAGRGDSGEEPENMLELHINVELFLEAGQPAKLQLYLCALEFANAGCDNADVVTCILAVTSWRVRQVCMFGG